MEFYLEGVQDGRELKAPQWKRACLQMGQGMIPRVKLD